MMQICTLKKIIKSIKFVFEIVVPYSVQDFCLRKFGNGTYLSQVEFHIVDHCNLNCAHCDHFTPVAEPYFYEINDIVENFEKLKKIFDNIGKIYILGGEPLLHPNLTDIFEPLRKIYPEAEIIIISNGILVEKQNDEFWDLMKKYDITLNMTHYPIKVNYEKIIDKCKNLGIKSNFFGFDRNNMQKMDLDIEGKRDVNKSFALCRRKRCHFLQGSKLFICTPAPNIRFLNKKFNLDFKISENDYIDLDKEKSACKINTLFTKPIPFCRYCSDKDLTPVSYRVSKKEIEEWVKCT